MEVAISGHYWPLLRFLSAFCIIYMLGYFVIFRNWSPKRRPDASSCFISLFHGTPAVFLALTAILDQPVRGFASPNTAFQNYVLDFSIAYFVVDLLHYIIFIPSDNLFIAHHLATLFVFTTCRYLVSHGAVAILVLLAFAEVTSACQNAWTLAGYRQADSPVAARIHKQLAAPFFALYTVMRGVAGPVFLYKMSAHYISGKASHVMPIWVCASWIAVIGCAIFVSIMWISNLWLEFFRDKKKEEKKDKGDCWLIRLMYEQCPPSIVNGALKAIQRAKLQKLPLCI